MKKVLALVVAFALCFTAFAGCFTTSAADSDAFAVSIADNKLNVTCTIPEAADYVILLKVTLPEGITAGDIYRNNEETPLVKWDETVEDCNPDYYYNGNLITLLDIPADTTTYYVELSGLVAEVACNATATETKISVNADYADSTAQAPTLETYQGTATYTPKVADHTPADAVEENRVEAQVGVAGSYDSVVYCSVCNHEISRTTIEIPALPEVPEHTCTYGELQYKVEDGNCITYQTCTDETCGAVNIIATVANGAFTHYPVFESGLVLKFAPKDQTIFTTYTDVYAYFVKDNYAVNANASELTAPTIEETVAEDSGTRKEFIFNGIFSYDMCNNIDIKVFGTDANGNKILILTEEYSMKAYIDTAYNSYVSKNQEDKADFVCDLASYGTASQLHFKRNIDNLPTAGLDLENYGTPNLAVEDFNVSETVSGSNVIQSGDFTFNRAAVFEEKISLNIRFPQANCSEGAYLKIDFVDYLNNSDSVIYTSDMFEEDPSNASRYLVNFSVLRAIELHGKYDISLCAADGSVIATCAYSYDTYAWQAANSTTAQTMKDLANRVVCYGRSTRKYFGYE